MKELLTQHAVAPASVEQFVVKGSAIRRRALRWIVAFLIIAALMVPIGFDLNQLTGLPLLPNAQKLIVPPAVGKAAYEISRVAQLPPGAVPCATGLTVLKNVSQRDLHWPLLEIDEHDVLTGNVIPRTGLQEIRGFPTVSTPIGPQVLLEILDRILVVVGEHQPAGNWLWSNLAEFGQNEHSHLRGLLRIFGIRPRMQVVH